jgi:hypothetical protein
VSLLRGGSLLRPVSAAVQSAGECASSMLH